MLFRGISLCMNFTDLLHFRHVSTLSFLGQFRSVWHCQLKVVVDRLIIIMTFIVLSNAKCKNQVQLSEILWLAHTHVLFTLSCEHKSIDMQIFSSQRWTFLLFANCLFCFFFSAIVQKVSHGIEFSFSTFLSCLSSRLPTTFLTKKKVISFCSWSRIGQSLFL